MADELANEPDPYWQQDAVNDRDEWDAHLRHVDEKTRDRLWEMCVDIAATRSVTLQEATDILAGKKP